VGRNKGLDFGGPNVRYQSWERKQGGRRHRGFCGGGGKVKKRRGQRALATAKISSSQKHNKGITLTKKKGREKVGGRRVKGDGSVGKSKTASKGHFLACVKRGGGGWGGNADLSRGKTRSTKQP